MTINKVLIVDDDPDIRSLYRLVLHQVGLGVIEAESGEEALSLLETEIPALVLLDVMMPEMDGYEVCRRLRDSTKTAELPILLFSANGTRSARRNGMLAGADDYMTKTAGPRAVVARIQTLLSEPVLRRNVTPIPATSG